MVKIAVLASFNMDLVMRVERRPLAGETLQGEFATHLGGKGFNQAVAARRLGAEVAVTGRVGDDDYGRAFLGALDAEGIDRRAVVVDPVEGTGMASIYVEPDGTNTIVQAPRANRNVLPADFFAGGTVEIDYANVTETSRCAIPALLHRFDATIASLETNDEALRGFHELAALATGDIERETLTVLNAAPARAVSSAVLGSAAVLVVNEVEAAAITTKRCEDLASARLLARELGAVITLGKVGAVSANTHAAAYDVPVVDTTGAGDAFCAALAIRLAEGAELADAMRFANAAGALACTKHGAYESMPARADVEALLAAQGASR